MTPKKEQVSKVLRRGKIEAVQDVLLTAPQGLEDALRWFYVELAGLSEVDATDTAGLRFRAERIDLRIHCDGEADVDPVPVRLVLRVPNLVDVASRLDERRLKYSRYAGLSYTDQAVIASDPAGYRVEFRRLWPDWPF